MFTGVPNFNTILAMTGSNAEFSENTIRSFLSSPMRSRCLLSPLHPVSSAPSAVSPSAPEYDAASAARSLKIRLLATRDFGWLKISSTRPTSTMLPFSTIATWLQISRITDIWCVIITIVMPNFRLISFKSARMDCVVCGSKALVASSQSRIFGSVARALAIATLCFCPPESCAG